MKLSYSAVQVVCDSPLVHVRMIDGVDVCLDGTARLVPAALNCSRPVVAGCAMARQTLRLPICERKQGRGKAAKAKEGHQRCGTSQQRSTRTRFGNMTTAGWKVVIRRVKGRGGALHPGRQT
eukprot:10278740-Alexandrium_andersonii.AAC.1